MSRQKSLQQKIKQKLRQLAKTKHGPWVVLLVLVGLLVAPYLPETWIDWWNETPQINQEVTPEAYRDFNGYNYEILPKLTKIPIQFERVVDGDTIIAKLNGHSLRIRYLMVDTPELNHGQPAEPFAEAASQRNEELLIQASTVSMVLDQGPVTDRYDRILAYVYADDQLISELLLGEGLATVRYVNPPNNSYEERFRKIEAQAQRAGVNLWEKTP